MKRADPLARVALDRNPHSLAFGMPRERALAPDGRGRTALRATPSLTSYREARRQFEREYWSAALGATGGNRELAAIAAGVDRSCLFRKLRALGFPRLRPARESRFGELGL